MQRLIPNKTKVRVELFRGVTVGDLIVCGIGLALLVFVITSNLPWKWGISVAIVGITALLLVRLDEQPNYIYFLHILSFFVLIKNSLIPYCMYIVAILALNFLFLLPCYFAKFFY